LSLRHICITLATAAAIMLIVILALTCFRSAGYRFDRWVFTLEETAAAINTGSGINFF
jgi:membrane protein YdbS with pleckstrin-like domain